MQKLSKQIFTYMYVRLINFFGFKIKTFIKLNNLRSISPSLTFIGKWVAEIYKFLNIGT